MGLSAYQMHRVCRSSRSAPAVAGPTGHKVCIYVDGPEAASRVDVLIDADGPVSKLTAVPGCELAPVRGIGAGGLQTADELGLIMDGCDPSICPASGGVETPAGLPRPTAARAGSGCE